MSGVGGPVFSGARPSHQNVAFVLIVFTHTDVAHPRPVRRHMRGRTYMVVTGKVPNLPQLYGSAARILVFHCIFFIYCFNTYG